jgi:hypothetical protein
MYLHPQALFVMIDQHLQSLASVLFPWLNDESDCTSKEDRGCSYPAAHVGVSVLVSGDETGTTFLLIVI